MDNLSEFVDPDTTLRSLTPDLMLREVPVREEPDEDEEEDEDDGGDKEIEDDGNSDGYSE